MTGHCATPSMKICQPDSGNPTVRDERGLAETWADGWKKNNRHVIAAWDEAFNESQTSDIQLEVACAVFLSDEGGEVKILPLPDWNLLLFRHAPSQGVELSAP